MNKNLQLGLQQMTEEEYHELTIAKAAGDKLRHMMEEYNLSMDQVAWRFHCSPESVEAMRNFYYEFTIRDFARINAYYEDLVIADAKEQLKEKKIFQIASDQLVKGYDDYAKEFEQFKKNISELEEKIKKLKLYNGPTSTA